MKAILFVQTTHAQQPFHNVTIDGEKLDEFGSSSLLIYANIISVINPFISIVLLNFGNNVFSKINLLKHKSK